MFLEIVLSIPLTYLTAFVMYLYFLVIVSKITAKSTSKANDGVLPYRNFAIIIPAHNEELLIGACLKSAFQIAYPKSMYDVIVVADNCDDSTAFLSRKAGAICFERTDQVHRGKPYALNWIFRVINLDNYDAYVIIDADTIIDEKFLWAVNREMYAGSHVIQGYFGISNPYENWFTRLMVIPGILKYKYRYIGKRALGLSCPLMGNGMCFSRAVIRKYGWDALTLTENWEYYVKLVLRGYYSTYCDEAYIFSQTARTLTQGKVQRTRWLKGRLQVIRQYLPSLISEFLKIRKWVILDAIIELLLPSISMLFNYTVILFFSCVLLSLVYDSGRICVYWSMILVLTTFIYFAIGILSSESRSKTLLALLKAPLFLGWKLTVSLSGLVGYRQKSWERTDRHQH